MIKALSNPNGTYLATDFYGFCLVVKALNSNSISKHHSVQFAFITSSKNNPE